MRGFDIFTDLITAGLNAQKQGIEEGLSYLDLRSKNVEYVKNAVKIKIKLFGSENKAK